MHVVTRTMADAISHLQLLDDKERQDVFDFIDFVLYRQHSQGVSERTKANQPQDLQRKFLAWRANYEQQSVHLDDGYGDQAHDEIWQNIRDKADLGRDVSF